LKAPGTKAKKTKKKSSFLGESEEEEEEEEETTDFNEGDIDKDLRLLLDCALPLLKSRNVAVVLSVVALYFHLAPSAELSKVIKSLIRITRSSREIQFVVLANIATIAASKPVSKTKETTNPFSNLLI
jgi:AP-3 complex subunit beta